MKNTIYIATLLLTLISCTAQQITPLEDRHSPRHTGTYYKDVNNLLNPFVGTYVYTQGNEEFKIELRKMLHSNRNNRYYEDALIGGYEYKVNNVVHANTFANLNTTFTDRNEYKLNASNIYIGEDWEGCINCLANTIWIDGSIKSITNIGVNEIRFKRVIHNGQEALKVLIRAGGVMARHEGDPIPVPQPASFPCCEEIIMIKQ